MAGTEGSTAQARSKAAGVPTASEKAFRTLSIGMGVGVLAILRFALQAGSFTEFFSVASVPLTEPSVPGGGVTPLALRVLPRHVMLVD